MELVFQLLLGVFVLFITCLLFYGTRTFNYWKDRDVLFIEPWPLIGNSKNQILRKNNYANEIASVYDRFKNERFVGMFDFLTPTLFVRDPDLINKMLTSDFSHFHDKATFVRSKNLNPLNSNLLNLTGNEWKNLRKKLSPAFSSVKLKTMMDELTACAERLVTILDGTCSDLNGTEVRNIMGEFTMNVIGSIAFGCSINTLTGPDSEFLKNGPKLFRFTFRQLISSFLDSFCPKLLEILSVKSLPKSVEDFYFNFVKESIAYRENNNFSRNDFLQLLINLRKEDASGASKYLETSSNGNNEATKDIEEKSMILDDTLMAANVFMFMVAGYETTAVTLSYCLLELAANQDIQQKLREEILAALKENATLAYDDLKNMTYMDQVISETLRKYSVAIRMTRICTRKYTIPGTDVMIDEGVKVVIPVYSIQKDPKYYPEPETFDPERFSEENKKNILNGTYLPFGGGPRICIGLRFALLELKVALAHTLPLFKFTLTDKMAYPLEFSKQSTMLLPKDGIWLKVTRIK